MLSLWLLADEALFPVVAKEKSATSFAAPSAEERLENFSPSCWLEQMSSALRLACR